MKKSLLALAVLGAFASAAQAQTSVTVYGLIDAAVQYRDQGGSGTATSGKTWSLSSGQMSGSRIGFRGTEDLGGGLSAIFTLENGFNVDTGSLGNNSLRQGGTANNDNTGPYNRLFGRQAWVGLQGGFGSVKLGRQQTVAWAASTAVDPFAASSSHGSQRIFGAGVYNIDPFLRVDNTISYTSANYDGLTGTAAYSFGEAASDSTTASASSFGSNRSYQFGASYVNGPINGQFAYMKTNQVISSNATSAFGTSLSNQTATYLLGGSYDLGVIKPFAAFVNTKFDDGVTSFKVRNYLLGLSAPVGAAGTVLASWIRNDVRDRDDGNQDQFSIGYVHNLSKRTNVYTAFSYNNSDVNGAIGGLTSPDGVAGGTISRADQSTKLLSVGVRHSF